MKYVWRFILVGSVLAITGCEPPEHEKKAWCDQIIWRVSEISVQAQLPAGANLAQHSGDVIATANMVSERMTDRCLDTVTQEQYRCYMAADSAAAAKACRSLARGAERKGS